MSVTQGTNWLAFSGVVVILLKLLGVTVADGDVQTVIGAIISIVGIVSNYVHRYKQGDVTVMGAKK